MTTLQTVDQIADQTESLSESQSGEFIKLYEDVEANFTEVVSESETIEVGDGGYKVLATLQSPAFFPDDFSRNKRYYKRELWEKVLSSEQNKKRLANRNVFGAIGHSRALDEESFERGYLSHIVTRLFLKKVDGRDVGFIELALLDTLAGRNIFAAYKAGSQLYLSSRAEGKFKGQYQGALVVDPDTYVWETFDFVMKPGFQKAVVQKSRKKNEKLQEEIVKVKKNNDIIEKDSFSQTQRVSESQNANILEKKSMEVNEQILENLTKQNGSLAAKINEQIARSEQLEATNEALLSENNTLKDVNESLVETKERLEVFEGIGRSADEIKASLDAAERLKETHESFLAENGSSLDAVSEAFELTDELNEAVEALGGFNVICEELKELAEYRKLFPTPSAVEESFDELTSSVARQEALAAKHIAEKLNEDFGVPVRTAYRNVMSMGVEDTVSLYESMRPVRDDSTQYQKRMDESEQPKAGLPRRDIKSALSRLNENHAAYARRALNRD